MKTLLTLSLVGALTLGASAVELSTFRVCQDQHVIRTDDGVEAGHVEYIVVEPASHRVVSTVITGGVIGERLVAVPIDAIIYGGEREITLRGITRERLVSAPAIERTEITRTTIVQPQIFERSYTHFGVQWDPTFRAERTSTNVNVNERSSATTNAPATETRARSATQNSATTNARARSGTENTSSTQPPSARRRTDTDNPARSAEQPSRTSTGAAASTDPAQQGRTTRERTNAPEPVGERSPARNENARENNSERPPADANAREGRSEPAREKTEAAREKSRQQSGTAEKAGRKSESAEPRSGTAERSEKSAGTAEKAQRAGRKAAPAAEPATEKKSGRAEENGSERKREKE